jgi:hypothetical protein
MVIKNLEKEKSRLSLCTPVTDLLNTALNNRCNRLSHAADVAVTQYILVLKSVRWENQRMNKTLNLR